MANSEKHSDAIASKIIDNVSKVIVGKDKQIRLLMVAMLCGGHVLLEDVPGTGKTKTARALAKSLDLDFKRIQFTIDLLPSDLTGINYFDRSSDKFVFRPGPLFTNILLADEINRATARTQSSLLECMEEKQVTVMARPTSFRRLSSLSRHRTRSNPRARSLFRKPSSTVSC